MTVRTYDLFLPAAIKLWLVFFAVVWVAMPIGLLAFAHLPGGPPWFVAVAFVGVTSLVWLKVLSIPHRIEVRADERIEFVAVLRRRSVPVSDILSVRPSGTQFGYLVFRHAGGRVAIANQFTGFHQFLSELAARNAGIEMLGC